VGHHFWAGDVMLGFAFTSSLMLELGVGLVLSTAPALAGVLHALRASIVRDYHAALLTDPLTRSKSIVIDRHMRRACVTCSVVAEMASKVRG
jgi:hypothetical protein